MSLGFADQARNVVKLVVWIQTAMLLGLVLIVQKLRDFVLHPITNVDSSVELMESVAIHAVQSALEVLVERVVVPDVLPILSVLELLVYFV